MTKLELGVKRGTVKLGYGYELWKDEYEMKKLTLQGIFGSTAIQIEHIGSTAIPNLIAKPLIDIAILVQSLDDMETIINELIKNGYVERVGRLSGRQRVFAKGGDLNVTHHLHVIEKGEPDWDDKIDFKTILISNLETRKQYSELKIKLFKKNENNRGQYSFDKGDFIKSKLSFFRSKKVANKD